MKRKRRDNRQLVRLANSVEFLIEPWKIITRDNSVTIEFPQGSRTFAKRYVSIK